MPPHIHHSCTHTHHSYTTSTIKPLIMHTSPSLKSLLSATAPSPRKTHGWGIPSLTSTPNESNGPNGYIHHSRRSPKDNREFYKSCPASAGTRYGTNDGSGDDSDIASIPPYAGGGGGEGGEGDDGGGSSGRSSAGAEGGDDVHDIERGPEAERELRALVEEERRIPMAQVGALLALEVVVVGLTIAKEGSATVL
jgi:hypothetical protein